jgi:hypothetical protein
MTAAPRADHLRRSMSASMHTQRNARIMYGRELPLLYVIVIAYKVLLRCCTIYVTSCHHAALYVRPGTHHGCATEAQLTFGQLQHTSMTMPRWKRGLVAWRRRCSSWRGEWRTQLRRRRRQRRGRRRCRPCLAHMRRAWRCVHSTSCCIICMCT